MKLINQTIGSTKAKYTITAAGSDLTKLRDLAALQLASNVKVPGFRPGKAPVAMIIKYADPGQLQNHFLNLAVNELFIESQKELNLRFVGEPKLSVSKFVPFTTLEISVETPIVKSLKLPEYAQLKLAKKKTDVTDRQLEGALKELQQRAAKLQSSDNPARNGDLVTLDFEATDPKTKQVLASASAQDYRLLLGDNTLIPGFEDQVVGLSKDQTKTFDLTFPKDYFDKGFASRKVSFKATIKEVNSVDLPNLDDDLAKQVGPFESFTQLKDELKKQLQAENDRQATVDLENQILDNLAEKTTVSLDDGLINQELEHLQADAKKSALNRGQTWKEFLASAGKTEEEYTKELKSVASKRLKAGLAIADIADNEGITVSEQELNQSIEILKSRYQDEAMKAELDNPANRRDIKMRLVTEKVLDFIQNPTAKPTKAS